jgi:hypothetical protein
LPEFLFKSDRKQSIKASLRQPLRQRPCLFGSRVLVIGTRGGHRGVREECPNTQRLDRERQAR